MEIASPALITGEGHWSIVGRHPGSLVAQDSDRVVGEGLGGGSAQLRRFSVV